MAPPRSTFGRRVVTESDESGRSRVQSDGPSTATIVLETLGGSSYEALWESSLPLHDAGAGGEPSVPFPYIADPGRARFMRLVVPPDSAIDLSRMSEIVDEVTAKAPGLLAVLDPSRGPGMHRTDSLDFLVIVSGRLDLELEADRRQLAAGDCIVQRGTWHAWRNPYAEPCVLVAVMLRCER